VVVNSNGTLANVFVYVKAGLEGKTFEAPTGPVTLDQKGCIYRPHVIGIRAGQTLSVANSDPTTHNVHPMPKANREWNTSQPPKAANLERTFPRPETMIPVKCNVHPWMKSWLGVMDHPYFAVTGNQGTFELKGLPPGDYTVEAWHEKYGTSEQKVTLAASANQTVEFTFKGE
jgi:plastocyanin